MNNLNPADELAEIRAEIARLKLREAALKAAFLQRPQNLLTGRRYKVEIREEHSKVFDPALLPQAIRDDPRYLRDKLVQVVQTLPLPAPAPSWPIRRDGLALH
jgi:hypothetical protein